ncbi:MAG: hypothetical protein QNJ58_28065 [Desulfobacterales bacterium]|nr:hypothetical protein [Desulfobacterales bacterium]
MAKKRSKFLLYCVCVWLCLSTSACGIRSTIQGQVVDAETGKPVEGAAMAIKWYEYKLVPPYASGYNQIETAEDLSDAEGFFQLPKYTFKHHYMGVYKTGYVCWNSEKIFHSDRLFYETRFEKRKDHKLNNGMVVKLAPFKETYPKVAKKAQ